MRYFEEHADRSGWERYPENFLQSKHTVQSTENVGNFLLIACWPATIHVGVGLLVIARIVPASGPAVCAT